jgi:hypothetical protein
VCRAGSFYNITYVVLINLVLQALISGLIIDSFSSMRDENEATLRDIQDKCFVCSIMRDELEEAGVSYQTHISEEHFMWDYFKFMIYLDLKDPLSFSSAENYAYRCLQDRQMFLQMMPINRSMTRETLQAQKRAAEDAARKAGADDVDEQLRSLAARLDELRGLQAGLAHAVGDVQRDVAESAAQQTRAHVQSLRQLHANLSQQLQQVVSVVQSTAATTAAAVASASTPAATAPGAGAAHSRRASSMSAPPPHQL